MELKALFSDEINGVATDFRAEVIAAEMIENSKTGDRILIVPLGASNRPHNKDVEGVEEELSEYDHKEYILIKTHKEGLYDQLPEGLFHTPISYTSDRAEQEIIEAIKRHRLEEKAARKFFLPFDAALNDTRIQIALYENQLDKKFHSDQLINVFSAHWEIFRYLNIYQANIFLQFLPLIHRIRDDWDAIEVFFEMMFLIPVKLEMRNQVKRLMTEGSVGSLAGTGLGESVLGVDFTTGYYVVGGEFVEMVITLGPMSASRLNKFTGEQQQAKVLLLLCDYLLSADVDIIINYDFAKSDRTFLLSLKDGVGNNCEIGVSTFL